MTRKLRLAFCRLCCNLYLILPEPLALGPVGMWLLTFAGEHAFSKPPEAVKPDGFLRLYLAGPMSGLPENNYPAFHAAAAQLRAAGYYVMNPAENDEPPCGTWEGYMRLAIAQLVTCDGVALLPGSRNSRGAAIEVRLATELKMTVEPVSVWLDRVDLPVGEPA